MQAIGNVGYEGEKLPPRNPVIMKFQFRIPLFNIPVILICLLASSGCKEVTCFSVTGDVVDRSYHIAPITGLEMHCEGEVFLSQGVSQSVVLHSDEELFKVLQFHITNGVLIMEFSEDCVEHIGEFKL